MAWGSEGTTFSLDSALVFLRLVDIFPPCPTLLLNTLKNAEEGGWGDDHWHRKLKNMDGNIGLKRQVSDFELKVIRAGVGVTVTTLIYVLSVAWTCGGWPVFSVLISQFKSDAFFYSIFFISRRFSLISFYSTIFWSFFSGGVDCDQILCLSTLLVKQTLTGLFLRRRNGLER